MDSLMCGVGVGWSAQNLALDHVSRPHDSVYTYVIPDTREGWVESVRLLLASYENKSETVDFDYSLIRPYGSPIKGFGGVASGPDPLKKLHDRIRTYYAAYLDGTADLTRFVADVVNAIGACVVAGNVRRSAQLNLGSVRNDTFLSLKDYNKYPERAEIGWMSNNSVELRDHDDFAQVPNLVERILSNGEPGILNMVNIQKYGRYGDELVDTATGTNPCSEATLESNELCCLVEIFPTRCETAEEFYKACELATFYASTISLLPTHQEAANAVITRNHRIGVSVSGVADWFDNAGASTVVTLMRKGYRIVEETNRRLAREAGVPESIRKTVVKPSGTVSLLAGVSSGMHYPPFTRYIRRMRAGEGTPLVPILMAAGVPYEPDAYSDNTLTFEFPVQSRAKRSQRDLSVWQKAAMVMLLQRHWADQMVSNTLTFDPKTEGKQLEDLLAFSLPFVKSLSLLPDTDEGAYTQMPYEPITLKEYERRNAEIKEIDWTAFSGSDGQDSRYCSNDSCEI
jgi:ribonucleoside-diphosphate reductase alpha chain